MIEHTFFLPIFTAAIDEKYFSLLKLCKSKRLSNNLDNSYLIYPEEYHHEGMAKNQYKSIEISTNQFDPFKKARQ